MLYRVLNAEAKAWWYHQDLRKSGRTDEARRRERKSILSTLDYIRQTLRNGGLLTIGRGGYTLHFARNSKLSGYGPDSSGTVAACKLAGVPWVDTRTIPDDRIGEFAVSGPIVKVGIETEGYGSLDYISPPDYIEFARSYGATVGNA